MNIEQKRTFIINTVYWVLIAAISVLVIRYIIPISLPFLFGFLVAFLVITISKKIRCENRWLRLLLAVAIYVSIGLLIGGLTFKGISLLSQVTTWLPELYRLKLLPALEQIFTWVEHLSTGLDPTVVGILEMASDSLVEALNKLITALSKAAVSLLSSVAASVPSALLGTLVMMFSTFFSVVDYNRIYSFTRKNLPKQWKHLIGSLGDYLTNTLFVVLKSYLLIMLITFIELTVLFTVFGIQHAVVKAAVIAVLDILPLLGTGGIMIPWAVISLIVGSTGLGIKLIVIYLIVTFVRNYIEPKIVGVQLGLHPIITLVSMFLGLRLFGFLGLFGLPVAISFLWKQRRNRMSQQEAGDPEPQ